MRTFRLVILLLLYCLLYKYSIAQTEKISNFECEISLTRDNDLIVREEITVLATGNDIRHGIYRSLPLFQTDFLGNSVKLRYHIVEVLCNEVDEDYFTEENDGFYNIYIGKEDVFLDYGYYTYSITYSVPNQVRFFDDYDEIYWNVTGNQWKFCIDSVKAVFKIPKNCNVINSTAYTGKYGEEGSDFEKYINLNGDIVFVNTRQLYSYEGLTIAISFPKGIIAEPSFLEKALIILADNWATAIVIIFIIVSLIYLIIVWLFIGRDPKKGTIMVNYYPPENLSPDALRYINRMGFDNKVFTSAIIQMAVKKFLVIKFEENVYKLIKTGENIDELTKGEQTMASALFGGRESLILKNTNYASITNARKGLKRWLKQKYEKRLFFQNTKYLLPAVIMTILSAVMLGIQLDNNSGSFFPTVWIVFWCAILISMIMGIIQSWKAAKAAPKNKLAAIILTIMILPFVGVLFIGTSLAGKVAVLPLAEIILFIGIDLLFWFLLKAPTQEGRKLMDQIEGFKMYLGATEKDELNFYSSMDKTPELYEKYLPYAIALGVENRWGERFDSILKQAMENNTYHNTWYIGASMATFSTSSFSSAFSSAVAMSSSTSRSGSSGGGFSGGGGGGGGGGGW